MKFRHRSDTSGYTPEVRDFPEIMPEYGLRINPETGKREVYKKGSTNVYEQKQAALPDTLIYNLIDRIERTGDMSLLGENLGGFIDVTNMPRNLMEAENVRLQAQQLYNSLPLEERNRYGNDFSAFLQDVNAKLKSKDVAAAAAKRDVVVKEPEANESK